jgi:hypothetical protein
VPDLNLAFFQTLQKRSGDLNRLGRESKPMRCTLITGTQIWALANEVVVCQENCESQGVQSARRGFGIEPMILRRLNPSAWAYQERLGDVGLCILNCLTFCKALSLSLHSITLLPPKLTCELIHRRRNYRLRAHCSPLATDCFDYRGPNLHRGCSTEQDEEETS